MLKYNKIRTEHEYKQTKINNILDIGYGIWDLGYGCGYGSSGEVASGLIGASESSLLTVMCAPDGVVTSCLRLLAMPIIADFAVPYSQ